MKKLMIAMAAAAMVGAANAEIYVNAEATVYADKDTSPSEENGLAWYSFYGMKLTDAETMSGVTGWEAITKWLGNNFTANSALVKNNEAATAASVFVYNDAYPGHWNANYNFQNEETDDFEESADTIGFFFFDNGTDRAYNVMGDEAWDNYGGFSDTHVGSSTIWNSAYHSGWIAVAPEPTSALLMLLGMAGLCLRRKQRV